jgi:hypothetical protein
MESIKTKFCKICNEVKDVTNFHKNGTTYHPYCKPCRSIERKKIRFERPIEGLRTCFCCKIEKDISEYHSDKSNPTGLQTYCKDCQTQKTKKCTSTLNGFIKKIYKDMYHNAEKRAKELTIELTIEDIHYLYNKQNGLCAISGLKMSHETYAFKDKEHIINRLNISIDRINSSLGYTKDNIQLVAAIVNRMKTDLPDNEFIKICSIITENNNNNK